MAESAFIDPHGRPEGFNIRGADLRTFGGSTADDALGPWIAWRTAAVLFWAAGVGAIVELWSGLIVDVVVHPSLTIAIAGCSLVLGCVWWIFGELKVGEKWLHIGVILSYAILVPTFANAPGIEAYLGIVYLVPLIYSALFLPSKSLFFYIALSVALIIQASLRHVDSEYGVIPGLLTIVTLVSTAGLTLYVRLELNRIERQAAALSGRDALTGLANLRPLYERLEQGLRDSERGYGGVTVIMLDLDGFKRVNDEHSHSAGDATLRVVAQAITDTVRRDELVARRGGDEFAIVTSATDPEDIATLVRRIGHNVSDARIDLLPGDGRWGVTVGYATSREGDTVGRLLARADRELHDAKARVKLERWSWRKRRLNDAASEIDDYE
jgi:diguanylate cyclase (GGDEF)-like protein